jgi:probable HAF family extracellular repeat protein
VLGDRCLLSTYTLTDLGSLDGRSAEAYGINDAGQVVGVSSSSAGSRAFLSQDGGLTDLGVLPGGTFSAANAINAPMPAGAAARQVTDAVFAGSHRAGPPARPGGWDIERLDLEPTGIVANADLS